MWLPQCTVRGQTGKKRDNVLHCTLVGNNVSVESLWLLFTAGIGLPEHISYVVAEIIHLNFPEGSILLQDISYSQDFSG